MTHSCGLLAEDTFRITLINSSLSSVCPQGVLGTGGDLRLGSKGLGRGSTVPQLPQVTFPKREPGQESLFRHRWKGRVCSPPCSQGRTREELASGSS